MARRIKLFEEFGPDKGIIYTEDEIESILSEFDGKDFFELDLEKTTLTFNYPQTLKDVETYKNGESGTLEFYFDVYFKADKEQFIEAIAKEFLKLEKEKLDDEGLLQDLKSVGFEKGNSATWEQIKASLESRFTDARVSMYVSIDESDLELAFESDEVGPAFMIRAYIEGYNGEIEFDSQEFSDTTISDLFYNKR